MLEFLRTNARWVAIAILVFFVGTMFTGAVFLGRSQSGMRQKHHDTEPVVAVYGTIPVRTRIYTNRLQQYVATLQQSGSDVNQLNPELLEFLEMQAFRNAVDYAVLLEAAHRQHVEISGQELELGFLDVYKSYHLSGKRELKTLLKSHGISFSDFEDGLRDEILVRKMMASIQSKIAVSDRDVENKYREIKLAHILFRVRAPGDKGQFSAEKADETARHRADQAFANIRKGADFHNVAKTLSDDTASRKTGGDLGWVKFGQLTETFQSVAFSLEKGELSEPVRTPFGYHLILVEDIRYLPKPQPFDLEKEKKAIVSARMQAAFQDYMASVVGQNAVLDIKDRSLLAIQAKLDGKWDKAIAAYQAMISQSPSNPAPYFLMGKLYILRKEFNEARSFLEKADVLADLESASGRAYIPAELGGVYAKLGLHKEANACWEKAIKQSSSVVSLTYLADYFARVGDNQRQARVNELLKLAKQASVNAVNSSVPGKAK